MSAGHPLDDNDRAGWLDILCDELRRSLKAGEHPVLTCSALKRNTATTCAKPRRAWALCFWN